MHLEHDQISHGIVTPPKTPPKDYVARAAEKRAEQTARIPSDWRLSPIPSEQDAPNPLEYIRSSGHLTVDELAITETTDVTDLLQKLSTGQLSSLQVVGAFSKRAAIAHQLTTCCTEMFFEEALEEAKRLDDVLARTGKPVGPLHGLPISVKDSVDVKGHDTSVGWVGLTKKPAARDAGITTMLRRLGAVLYVKTNIPQSLMMSDSFNHVFGQCVHPLNRSLISGGSSGGESTIIGAGGSVIGVGTDIGGSIRIPASLCGIYGLSPTYARHPYERAGPKQRIVLASAGPMASSLSGIEAYMQALPEARPWELDNLVVPMPWRAEECSINPPGRKLKIGFILDDGVVKPQPPIERAVKKVIAALKSAGHDVFEWDASSHGYAYDLWKKAVMSDGGLGCKRLCDMSGEPLVEGMLVGTSADLLNTEQTHQLQADIDAYKAEYSQRWHESQVDAIITPVTPWVGYKPWTWVKSHQYVGYTTLSNLLDWAGLSIPVTTVSRDEDHVLPSDWTSHQPRNLSDEFNKNQYDVDLVDSIPVGVQIMAGKYGDEKCIAVAKVIEALLKE
ncbi:hypothetical protein NM208_g9207 [Fusarium decemcellulare]|uniref:Uncharacterized protein n=1 Tax=Fusarium decemcellulare TaxID=57161 RepID=A0ACC1S2J5_9HYPO|nr:hypothetical protein NM208_g9207 [Fusarium decemcellulare]